MPNDSPIFVVGTGRSGTHFLLSILLESSELTDLLDGKENSAILAKITNGVIYSKETLDLYLYYSKLIKDAQPLRLVDKHHTNMWNVGALSSLFPNAKFLALVRDPFSVVYSTLNHLGTRNRLTDESVINYPTPCEFFGITGPFTDKYIKLSLEQRAALRWCSHMRQISDLSNRNSNVMPVRYESLLLDSTNECKKISNFLELSHNLNVSNPKKESLYKKNKLNETQKSKISSTIMEYFNYYGFPSTRYVPVMAYLK